MFTGLIEEIGTVASLSRRGDLLELCIDARSILEDITIGDSISVAGVCLTVTAFNRRSLNVQAVRETMRRTTLGLLGTRSRANLERSLKVGDRLGGHFVFGHVEAVGTVSEITPAGEGKEFRFTIPAELDPYIVEKGSIAVDGVSLTVMYARPGEFGIAVIPHTLAVTTLGENRPGDKVNIETDIFAKYAEKYARPGSGLTMETLRRSGFA